MPPKQNKTKSANEKSNSEVRRLSTHMSMQQLEEQINRLREKLQKKRIEHNYFQLEREKIHSSEITKGQLDKMKSDFWDKEIEMEAAEESYQSEIRLFNQRVKHLLYEQQTNIAKLKAEGVMVTKLQEKLQVDLENELRRRMRTLKIEAQEQKFSYENYIKNLKLSHDKELSKMRSTFEKKVQEIEAGYKRKLKRQQEMQDLRRKTEVREIIQRKTVHANMLIKNKASNDTKDYYTELTRGNVDQLIYLQKQVVAMKKTENRLERELAQLRQQNKALTEPLQKATEEASELKMQLANYNMDKAKLAKLRTHFKDVEKELNDLKLDQVVLEEAFNMMQQERDDLYEKFTEVQQKRDFKNLLLEKKLSALRKTMEKKDTELIEVRHMITLMEMMKADIEKGVEYLDQPKLLRNHYTTLQNRYILNKEHVGNVPITDIPEVTEEISRRVDRVGQGTVNGNAGANKILDKGQGPSACHCSSGVRFPPIKKI